MINPKFNIGDLVKVDTEYLQGSRYWSEDLILRYMDMIGVVIYIKSSVFRIKWIYPEESRRFSHTMDTTMSIALISVSKIKY